MATINTIRKQIEIATKRMESAKAKIAMYDEKLTNTIANAVKATGIKVDIDNYRELLMAAKYWIWVDRIFNNIRLKRINEKIVSNEVERLELLNEKLTK